MPSQPNKSLQTGFACLQYVARQKNAVSVKEIAQFLQMTPSKISRIMGTLTDTGLLKQNKSRKYLPGLTLHALSASCFQQSNILALVLPHLQPWQDIGFTIGLGILWNKEIIFLYHQRSMGNFNESFFANKIIPYYLSSIGMILASKDIESNIKDISIGNLDGFKNRIFDLKKELILASENKYAALEYKNNEISIGISFEHNLQNYGIGISSPYIQVDQVPLIAKQIIQTGINIENQNKIVYKPQL